MYVTPSLFFFSSFKGLQKFVFQKSSFLAQKVAFKISSLLYFFSSLSNITFVLSLTKYFSSNKSFKETKISSTTLLYVICFIVSCLSIVTVLLLCFCSCFCIALSNAFVCAFAFCTIATILELY